MYFEHICEPLLGFGFTSSNNPTDPFAILELQIVAMNVSERDCTSYYVLRSFQCSEYCSYFLIL